MARRRNAAPAAVQAAQAASAAGASAPVPVAEVLDQGKLGQAELEGEALGQGSNALGGDVADQPEGLGLSLLVQNDTPSRFREILPGQSGRVEFDNAKQRDAFLRMVRELNELEGREGIKLKESHDG